MKPQIWGCERAKARSHPQIWDLLRKLPTSRYSSDTFSNYNNLNKFMFFNQRKAFSFYELHIVGFGRPWRTHNEWRSLADEHRGTQP
jgi:hypothetical protein